MPVNTIIHQATTNQLLAAYRPIVFKVEATSTSGDATPPYVVCDIYIGDVYYKSIIRTAPESSTALLSTWSFDISDALQEYLAPDIAAIDNTGLLQATHMSAKVFCKFRSSDIDVDGFTVEEGVIPIQATRFTAAVSGTGLQSNNIFVVNASLQHEDNQNLQVHLNSFKTGTWKADAFPLTHRSTYHFCNNDSDHYPVIFTGACIDVDLVLNYKLKGSSSFLQATAVGGGTCDPAPFSLVVTGNKIDVSLNDPLLAGESVLVQYKKQSDTVWIDAGTFTIDDFFFYVNPADPDDYDIRVIHFCNPCFSGTATVDTFTLSGTVTSTDWRGINPACVIQSFDPPIYIVLELRNYLVSEIYFPDNINPIFKRNRETNDLYAKFYSDAAHLNPVSVTQSGLKIYIKKTETREDDTGTGVFLRVVETVQTFTVNAAGVEVLLGNVIISENIDNYSPFPTISSSSDSTFIFEMYPDHLLLGGNTGQTLYANLEEYNTVTGTPTGVQKPNDSGDPDYIPPFDDTLVCPTGPNVTNVSYGSGMEISKVEMHYGSTFVYSDTVTDTDAGGYNYVHPLPKNTNINVTVKARRLSSSASIKVRVSYGAGLTAEFDVPGNIETTLPQIFQNITSIVISQT